MIDKVAEARGAVFDLRGYPRSNHAVLSYLLTNPAATNAISYAETIMAIVEHNKLGAIVGGATAGTNGNVVEVTAPTGCRTRFTGMRVTKPDGARFHLVGIQPTIPASRTVAGVVAGRDEVLEKALAYIRGEIQ